MIQNILKSIHTKFGTYVISVILGLDWRVYLESHVTIKIVFPLEVHTI